MQSSETFQDNNTNKSKIKSIFITSTAYEQAYEMRLLSDGWFNIIVYV